MNSPELKDLPPGALSALSAFREERPSAPFEYRLHLALQEAEEARTQGRVPPAPVRGRLGALPHPSLRLLTVSVLMGLILATVLVSRSGPVDHWARLRGGGNVPTECLPSHQVAFQLPEQGAGWLELPWMHGAHSGAQATVRMETPAELNFHQHARDLPSLKLVSCEAGRCVHQFTASTGETATPLRVRIDKPGRYEFRVSHASGTKEVHEHFVVVADH